MCRENGLILGDYSGMKVLNKHIFMHYPEKVGCYAANSDPPPDTAEVSGCFRSKYQKLL